MPRCQLHELLEPRVEEWIAPDEERASLQSHKESRVDFAVAAGRQNEELHPLGARCLLRLLDDVFGRLIVRVHK